jgi:pimeloyl-ACP methyl ester carboxylesterase
MYTPEQMSADTVDYFLAGTAQDTSTLIDFLPAYIFPNSERSIAGHFALGVSLGGHATWLCLLHDPRITAGVVVVGAPDFVALMADRARLSKLVSWLQSDPPGSSFLGSKHFPTGLLETVQKRDPAAVLSSQLDVSKKIEFIKTGAYAHPPDDDAEGKAKTQSILDRHLRGKRILCLSGATDKLVPYRLFEPFMAWLKTAVGPGERDIYLEDLVFENTAHELTDAMMQEALRFIYDSVVALDRPNNAKTAKI